MSLVLQSSGGGQITIQEPATASNFTQTLPAGTGTTVVNGVNGSIVSGTAVASTSGTSIDFTGIPSWVKRITVMFSGVSTNGSSALQVQLGTSGGVQTTSYTAASILSLPANIVTSSTITTGFGEATGGAVIVRQGSAILSLLDSSTGVWSMMYNIGTTD